MQQQEFNNFTDIKIIDNGALPELNSDIEAALVKHINEVWEKSKESRRDCNGYDLTSKIEEIEKAERLEHPDSIKNKPIFRSKVYLPWIKQSHVSVVAYLAAMMLSGQWFAITGNTPEDSLNAERMTKVFNYKWENDYEFRKTIIQVLYQFVKKGMTCCKGLWKLIKTFTYEYEESQDESGQPIFTRNKAETTIYNDVKVEYIDIDNYHFYPVNKPLCEVTQVYGYSEKYTELMRNDGGRFIPEKLAEIQNKSTKTIGLEDTPVELKEAWIHDCVIGEGVKLNNIIVTIADNKVIEYKENFHDYGITPFSWSTFETIEGTNLGKGLCFDGIDLQQAANLLFNALLDSVKIGVYPMMMIPEQLDPNRFISRPAGLIPLPNSYFEKGIKPEILQQDLSRIPITFETIFQLKKEFESATVPDFIKGVRPEKDETATRDMLVQQGSENKLTVAADNFNEEILKQVLRLMYILYRQRSQIDVETRLQLAKIFIDHTKEVETVIADTVGNPTGETELITVNKTDEELLAEFEEIYPLERVDISIDGYKTSVKKQQVLKNLGILLEQVSVFADEYTKVKLNQENILKEAFLSLDFNSDDFLMSDDELIEYAQKKIEALGMIEAYKQLTMLKYSGGMPNVQQPPNGQNNKQM